MASLFSLNTLSFFRNEVLQIRRKMLLRSSIFTR